MADSAVCDADVGSSAAPGDFPDDETGATSSTRAGSGRVVYVVVGQREGRVNDRVRKILELESKTTRFQLVTRSAYLFRGRNNVTEPAIAGGVSGLSARSGEYAVPAYPNPLGVLRWLGLDGLRKKLSRYLLFPSSQILYVRRAVKVLRRSISADLGAGREVVLLTCLPPHDLAILGTRLKQEFPAIRWCADWQDLWSHDENYASRVPQIYQERLLETEKAALDACDMNITTNHKALQVLTGMYGVSPECLVAIPHHFQCSGPRSGASSSLTADRIGHGSVTHAPVRIAFLGSLFKPPRVPGNKLLEVFTRLRKEFEIDLELHLYGRLPSSVSSRPELVRDSGVVVHPQVPHDQVVAELSQYDFLILLLADLPNCRVVMSIKLPQYLIAGPPILAMVPEDSCIAEVVRDTGTGYVIDTGSDWARGLLSVLNGNGACAELPVRNESMISRYSWNAVSRLWSDVLAGTRSYS